MDFQFMYVNGMPETMIPGAIYFDDATHAVYIAKSESEKVAFAGIMDAVFSGNTLTLTKADGSKVAVNLTSIIGNAIAGKMDIGEEGDSSTEQTYFGLKALVNEIASKVYRPMGSKTIAEIKALTGVKIGDVYNVTDTGVLNDIQVKAGDNVAALKTGAGNQTGMWDNLAGIIDTSNLVPVTRKVNGKVLSSDVTLTGEDITVGGSGNHATKTVEEAIGALEEQIVEAAGGGVQSVGGQNGAITLDTSNANNGEVKFSMDGKKIKGAVNGLKDAAFHEADDFEPAGALTQAKKYVNEKFAWSEWPA